MKRNIYMHLSEYAHLPFSSFNTSASYFLCPSEGHATFRAHLFSNNATIEAVILKGALRKWLHSKKTDASITMYGRRHSIEPGPCGETISHLFPQECTLHSDSAVQGQSTLGTRDSTFVVHGMCSL